MASKVILRSSMSFRSFNEILHRLYLIFIPVLFWGRSVGGDGRNVIAREGCDFSNLAAAGERR